MHDARGVGLGECFSNVLQVTQQLRKLIMGQVNAIAESLTVDKLHRDKVSAFKFTDLVDVGDVRMIQRSSGLRLLFEALQSFPIRSKIRGQYFERHIAIDAAIACEINVAHSAFSESCANFVAADFCA